MPRQVVGDTATVAGQLVDDLAPQVGADEEPWEEHGRRAFPHVDVGELAVGGRNGLAKLLVLLVGHAVSRLVAEALTYHQSVSLASAGSSTTMGGWRLA